MENSVRSVTHSVFGRSAWKSLSTRFADALSGSPLYELYRFALLNRGARPCPVMSLMIRFALATIPMPFNSRWIRLYPYLRLPFPNASRTSSSRPESLSGRFMASGWSGTCCARCPPRATDFWPSRPVFRQRS